MNDVSQIVPPQRILLGLGGRGGRRRGGRLSLSLGHAVRLNNEIGPRTSSTKSISSAGDCKRLSRQTRRGQTGWRESPEAKARGVRREIGGATGERASVRGSQGGHVGPRADPASGRTHLK